MEKNTKWAIALCTVVLVVWGFSLSRQKKENAPKPAQPATVQTQNSSESNTNGNVPAEPVNFAVSKVDDLNFSFSTKHMNEDTQQEEKFISVSFTNKGGDITGYELVNFEDFDIKKNASENETNGVEMVNYKKAYADSEELNPAFSIAASKNGVLSRSFITDNFEVSFTPKFYENIDSSNKEELKKYVSKENTADDSMAVTFRQTFKDSADPSKSYTLSKKYTFAPSDYMFKLDVSFEGNAPDSYILKNASTIGPKYDLSDRYEYRNLVYYNIEDDDEEERFDEKTAYLDNKNGWNWFGVAGKYFENLIIPADLSGKTVEYFMKKSEDKKLNKSEYNVHLISTGKTSDTYYIYMGPRTEDELKKYNSPASNPWNLTGVRIDYSMPGSGFLSWLQTLLKWILEFFHWIIPNWGVAIILTTLVLKVCLFPLTKKSLMGTQKMQKLQPQMQAIKEKYKNNPQKMQQETAKLYKESGYNPISGCLPMILQFLVLFAMYQLFNNYFEFRGSSFIPGWIDDLSRGDEVYVMEKSFPIIGDTIRLLPVIYLVSQLFYGKITQNGGTAQGSGMNMKIMMYGMPIFFFVLFYAAPSGLLLYWTISNIFQLFQQLFVNKMMKNNAPAATDNKKFKIAKK